MKNFELRRMEGRGAMAAVCESQFLFKREGRSVHRGMYDPKNKVKDSIVVTKQRNSLISKEREMIFIKKNQKSLPPWLGETVLADKGFRR